MVDFFEFLHISKHIVDKMNYSEILTCWNFHSKNHKKKLSKNIWNARLFLLGLCYQQLYPHYYLWMKKNVVILNDYFLDFETQTQSYKGTDKILIWSSKKEAYLFTFHEIMSLIHSNLSNSEAIVDARYMTCSIVKSFRLPTNPYTGKTFSFSEMKQIVGQILLYIVSIEGSIHNTSYPEVFLYLCHFQEIHRTCPNEEKRYEVIQYLDQFFNRHHLKFNEKYKTIVSRKECENESGWKGSLKRKDMELFKIFEHLNIS